MRSTRMGNNVPDRVCTAVGIQVLDGCAQRAPALPLNTPERFASPSATVPLRRFSCEICPWTNAHSCPISVARAKREAKISKSPRLISIGLDICPKRPLSSPR
jgi:hypothetical protein